MTLEYPVPGKTYSLEEVLTKLSLRDSPFLRFEYYAPPKEEGQSPELVVLQDGHIGDEALLAIPELAKSQWRYQYTTHEDCPLFLYVDIPDIMQWVTVEDNLRAVDDEDKRWAYFNADPRPQR